MTIASLDRLGAGVHDIDERAYHADPVTGGSLSSTGARTLVQPAGPARFRWEQDHPAPPKREWELGHAAHKLVLGVGPEFQIIDAPDYRTRKAQQARNAAYDAGLVPLLTREHDQVQAMADAIRQHPVASALFNPARGAAEQTLIWQDPETGVWRRARPDWLPHLYNGRLILGDYKTTTNAAREAIRKTIANFRYHQQQAWYVDGVRDLGLAQDVAFIFIFQEKHAPFLIHIVQLDNAAEDSGREENRRALRLYAHCAATGVWPGYNPEITLIDLPPWATTYPEECM
ncbi:PD-(D/E)XK nuclease-like domain-containing protein [Nonomuraea zeae]|uniref:Putative exodeoxyribonuclease 8 PDDEXK-like domain-containing protein n=1 Tax=Nonomuraea zeae TaxID=1642303 RepID=A0A5S4H2Z6_9ACTN|nr:PD-(D/E)XK nuclease-like domain-containing protein [Nonomuraea zeae]TMR39628.1 hypothetical protein ETD85_01040 [Nonomuraea zeae]